MTVNPYEVIGAYWVFSAIAGGAPEPLATSSVAYTWCYRSMHILAGNIQVAIQSKFKGLPEPLPPDSLVSHTEQATVLTPKA